MESRLIILTLIAVFSLSGHLFAEEGVGKNDPKEQLTRKESSDTSNEMRFATDEDINNFPNVGNKFCPITGNAVDDGSMGEAVKYVYNGKIYNLCCKMCAKDFKKNPEKYSKIAEEEVAQSTVIEEGQE